MKDVTPALKVVNDKIHMSVPYALNAPFRALFKTAKWLPSQKVFEASDTKQNHTKWQQFIDATVAAQQKLAQAEHVEASAEELAALRAASERALAEIQERIEDAQAGITQAQKALARATEQKTQLAPALEAAQVRLEEHLARVREAEAERNAAMAPVLRLYANHDLDDILREFKMAAQRGYSGKDALGRAQKRLERLVKGLTEVGYRVQALNELCGVSLNRHDKVPNLVEGAEAAKLSGVVALLTTDSDE